MICLIDLAMTSEELLAGRMDEACINMLSGRHAGMTMLMFSVRGHGRLHPHVCREERVPGDN